jgi:hypothetical protein
MNALVKLFKSSKSEEPDWEGSPAYSPPVRNTKIRMKETAKASVNGFQIEEFKKGEIHEVTALLAESLIRMGAAEKV